MQRRMRIQLGRILVHDLLGMLERILAFQLLLALGRAAVPIPVPILDCHHFLRLALFLGMLVDEQILDGAFARRGLVDGETGGEFLVRADLDRVQHRDRKCLAVVGDQVVCGPRLAHVVDHHFACLFFLVWKG